MSLFKEELVVLLKYVRKVLVRLDTKKVARKSVKVVKAKRHKLQGARARARARGEDCNTF